MVVDLTNLMDSLLLGLLLHVKITHFDSVTSVIITKVASVAFCSQGHKCLMFLTSVASVREAYCHDAYVVPITT
jgi:hypothetical protein